MMKEIIGILIFCGLTQTIAAASREDYDSIRRLAISPSSEYSRYLSKKRPAYSYKPYYRPRPTYTIPFPIDKPYEPTPVKKPTRPNYAKPSYSYQPISRPDDYVPRPPKPTSSEYLDLENKPDIVYQQTRPIENSPQNILGYPNRPNKPDDIYNPSNEIYSSPKPKPFRPSKPNENIPQNYLDYPDRPNRPNRLDDIYSPSDEIYNSLDNQNKPEDLFNPYYQRYKPKPKPKPKPRPPTYSKPVLTTSRPHTYNHLDSNEPSSYQSVKPTAVFQAYPSYTLSSGASYDRPASTVPYPIPFLQEPSNTYEDDYSSQFYDTQQEKPVQTTSLSQYLQDDNNWRPDEDSYYDRFVFYPHELNYGVQRPNGNDDIYDYPEIIEELKEAIFKKDPQQARSIRRHSDDVLQRSDTHPRGLMVPYKTWEYNPSAHNLLKSWMSKFHHPYKWWFHKKPEHIYFLQNKFHKPLVSNLRPYNYLNSNSPYLWGHLPLLSTRPDSVHRIRNFFMDQSDSPMEGNYSDEVLENYLNHLGQTGGFF